MSELAVSTVKPCRTCQSTNRNAKGKCKPCAARRQRERNALTRNTAAPRPRPTGDLAAVVRAAGLTTCTHPTGAIEVAGALGVRTFAGDRLVRVLGALLIVYKRDVRTRALVPETVFSGGEWMACSVTCERCADVKTITPSRAA